MSGIIHSFGGNEDAVAPPVGRRWTILWTTDAPEYGGTGTPHLEADRVMQGEHAPEDSPDRALKADPVWHIPGECAVLLIPRHNAPTSRAD